jgi:Ser/Thr protein kinase RdoA (MazF antagonist)
VTGERPIAEGEEEEETPLPRGDVTEGVVRVGSTVRRPRGPQSDSVAAYLAHLDAAEFGGAPRWHGVDGRGRDVLDYLPGEVPGSPPEPWAATDAVLEGVAGLLRRLHAASAGFRPPDGSRWFGDDLVVELPAEVERLVAEPELVSHCDVTPQNVVFRERRPWGLIDFDLSRPTTHLLDVLNTAMHWVPLRHPRDREDVHTAVDAAARLRRFVDAYGLPVEDRLQLVDLGRRAALRSWHLMRANARARGGGWSRMWEEGVGDVILRRREWLADERQRLTTAMVARRP